MKHAGSTGRPEVARRPDAQDEYLSKLTARLAAEDFAGSDQDLPDILRAIAEQQTRSRRTRDAVHLHRAALLLEQQLAPSAAPSKGAPDA